MFGFTKTIGLALRLLVLVAGRLARYKCPRIYARVDTIPKGANNKLLRQVLRKSYEETLGEA